MCVCMWMCMRPNDRHDGRSFPLAPSVTGQSVPRAHAVGALSPARSRDQTRSLSVLPWTARAGNVGEIIRSIVVNNISGSLSQRRYLSPASSATTIVVDGVRDFAGRRERGACKSLFSPLLLYHRLLAPPFLLVACEYEPTN